jgi:hypothetical protein
VPLKRVDFSKKLEPIDWLVDDLLLKGYLNFLASLPGQGKTTLLTGLAWQLSRPEGKGNFLGASIHQGRSIYVDYDAPADGRSVRYWLDKHQVAYPDGNVDHITLLEPDKDTFGLAEPELTELEKLVKEQKASLVIIDSFMAAFPNTDPVKLTQVQGPLWYLRRLATETGAAVVLIDHLPKPITGEVAGMRGVMGSIAKPAQSRAVHILTRVPPKEVQGKHVLRWDVQKMSYAALPEPFGIELVFEGAGVRFQAAQLPDEYGESKTDKAVRVMYAHLLELPGQEVSRKELLDVAIQGANLKERAAADALKTLLERECDTIAIITKQEKGKPVFYQLKGDSGEKEPEKAPSEKPTALKHEIAQTPSLSGKHLMQTALHEMPSLHQIGDKTKMTKAVADDLSL